MLKLTVSANRKVSDNNYGSTGAAASIEFELDNAAIGSPDVIRQAIRDAHQVAELAVCEALGCESPTPTIAAKPVEPRIVNGQPHPVGPAGKFLEEPAKPAPAVPDRLTGRGSRGGRNLAKRLPDGAPRPNLPPAPRADGQDLNGREPRDGRELLGWISSQGKLYGKPHEGALYEDAEEAGRRLGYGAFFKAWTEEQVRTVYNLIRPSTAHANGTA
jgi:hypothetical protein